MSVKLRAIRAIGRLKKGDKFEKASKVHARQLIAAKIAELDNDEEEYIKPRKKRAYKRRDLVAEGE